ncbi:hypothetical protein DZK27_11805 [Rhodobacteraceae bacterium 63075]|nr:hypothetical protein DZK27_11805 [Rhodobacteraceae bacterium 63075]
MTPDVAPPLTRGPLKARPAVELTPDISLALARVHEACGAARHVFALWLAAQMDGPVFWIKPAWAQAGLNPAGVAEFIEPSRLTLIAAPREEDVLWCMEEALAASCVPLVVAEPLRLPALTPVRRLHLAAGRRAGRPTGLLLTPGEGGAQGVESRWHMQPAASEDETPRWTLTRTRARTAPEKSWDLRHEDGQITVFQRK